MNSARRKKGVRGLQMEVAVKFTYFQPWRQELILCIFLHMLTTYGLSILHNSFGNSRGSTGSSSGSSKYEVVAK